MNWLARFVALPSLHRALLFRAWIELLRARVGLSLLPFAWHAARIVCTQPGTIERGLISSQNVAWAVGLAARFVPYASCLTQALAAKRMLNDAGIPSQVRFACGKNQGGTPGAHAWVECAGKVLLGPVPAGMAVLPPLPPLSR